MAVLLAVQYATLSGRSVPSHCTNVLWYCCAGWLVVTGIHTRNPTSSCSATLGQNWVQRTQVHSWRRRWRLWVQWASACSQAREIRGRFGRQHGRRRPATAWQRCIPLVLRALALRWFVAWVARRSQVTSVVAVCCQVCHCRWRHPGRGSGRFTAGAGCKHPDWGEHHERRWFLHSIRRTTMAAASTAHVRIAERDGRATKRVHARRSGS